MKVPYVSALLLVGALSGCGGGKDSTVVVSVTRASGVTGVTRIRATVSNAGTSDVLVFPGTSSQDPITLAIVLSSARSGVLDIALDGLSDTGATIANGTAQAIIVAGDTTYTSALLTPGPSLCGNRQVDPGETCDDGDRFSGDGCSFECWREGADGGSEDGSPDSKVDAAEKDVTPSIDVASSGDAGADSTDEPLPLPGNFVAASAGGYKLGAAFTSIVATGSGLQPGPLGCQQIAGVVRDFKGKTETDGHPDFESFLGGSATPGLVGNLLGPDLKPVYTSLCEAGTTDVTACPYGQETTSSAAFGQWYRNVSGVNMPNALNIWLTSNMLGGWTFQSAGFFPIDGTGWGDTPGYAHNYGFTTEWHLKFQYRGGEHFAFTGDDDVWVFINRKLAIDLGGLHASQLGAADLDQLAANLGLSRGGTYPLDIFHAERHTIASNFSVDTDLLITECGTLVP